VNIRELFEHDGRGYNQLARDTELCPSVVWRIVNGHTRKPFINTAAKLAAVLGVGVNEIVEAIKEQKEDEHRATSNQS
jgi:transcriptional regulator with XRE-family HTH domain